MKKINSIREFRDLLIVLKDNMKQRYAKKDLLFLEEKGFELIEIEIKKWYEQKHVGRLKDGIFQFSLKLNRTSGMLLAAQIELDEDVFRDNLQLLCNCVTINNLICVATIATADQEILKSYILEFSVQLDINNYNVNVLRSNFEYLIIIGDLIYGFNSSKISHILNKLGVEMNFDELINNCLRTNNFNLSSDQIPVEKINEFTNHIRRKNKIQKLLKGA